MLLPQKSKNHERYVGFGGAGNVPYENILEIVSESYLMKVLSHPVFLEIYDFKDTPDLDVYDYYTFVVKDKVTEDLFYIHIIGYVVDRLYDMFNNDINDISDRINDYKNLTPEAISSTFQEIRKIILNKKNFSAIEKYKNLPNILDFNIIDDNRFEDYHMLYRNSMETLFDFIQDKKNLNDMVSAINDPKLFYDTLFPPLDEAYKMYTNMVNDDIDTLNPYWRKHNSRSDIDLIQLFLEINAEIKNKQDEPKPFMRRMGVIKKEDKSFEEISAEINHALSNAIRSKEYNYDKKKLEKIYDIIYKMSTYYHMDDLRIISKFFKYREKMLCVAFKNVDLVADTPEDVYKIMKQIQLDKLFPFNIEKWISIMRKIIELEKKAKELKIAIEHLYRHLDNNKFDMIEKETQKLYNDYYNFSKETNIIYSLINSFVENYKNLPPKSITAMFLECIFEACDKMYSENGSIVMDYVYTHTIDKILGHILLNSYKKEKALPFIKEIMSLYTVSNFENLMKYILSNLKVSKEMFVFANLSYIFLLMLKNNE